MIMKFLSLRFFYASLNSFVLFWLSKRSECPSCNGKNVTLPQVRQTHLGFFHIQQTSATLEVLQGQKIWTHGSSLSGMVQKLDCLTWQ